MNFNDFLSSQRSRHSHRSFSLSEEEKAEKAEKTKEPSGEPSKNDKIKEWENFMKVFFPFVLYIGPTRLERMLLDLRNAKSFNLKTIMKIDDPSGRDNIDVRVADGEFRILDPMRSVSESIKNYNFNKSSVNEGFIDFVCNSILLSLGAQIKAIGKWLLEEPLKNFKINPTTKEEQKANDKLVEFNNVLNSTIILNIKKRIWGNNIEALAKKTSDNDNPSITWVKTCDCSKINFKMLRPIGRNVLNANAPWKGSTNPEFDVALKYICLNYGVRFLADMLLKNFKK